MTAPQGSSFLNLPLSASEGPPVLNTLIDDSSLKFDELLNPEKDPAEGIVDMHSSGLTSLSPPFAPSTKIPTSRSVSGDPVSRSKASPSSLSTRLDTQPLHSSRLTSSQPMDEEWMRSVLMAADAPSPSHSK